MHDAKVGILLSSVVDHAQVRASAKAYGAEILPPIKNAIGQGTRSLVGEVRKATRIIDSDFKKLGKSIRGALSIDPSFFRGTEKHLDRLLKFDRAFAKRFTPMLRDIRSGLGGMAERDLARFQREEALLAARRAFPRLAGENRVMMARSRRVAPSIDPSLGAFGRFAVSTASSIFILDHIARIFLHRVINPMIDAAKAFVAVNEDAMRFRIGASTALGGLGNATQLDHQLARRNRALPIARADLREAVSMLMMNPGTSGSMAMSAPAQVANQASDLALIAARLRLIDPLNVDARSASIALREGLEGDVRSIQRRFGLSREAIARAAGVEPRDVSNDPQMFLRGVKNLTETLVDQRAVDALNNLPSAIGEHIRDSFGDVMTRIGDAGAFKAIQSRVGELRTSVYDYVDSPASAEAFKHASSDVERILDNLANAGARFVHALAGTKDGSSSVEAVAQSAEKIFNRIADLSGALPDATENLGAFIRQIGVFVDDLFDQAARMKAGLSVSGAAKGVVKDWQLRLHPSMARERELQVMSDTLGRIDPRLSFGVERQYGSSFSTQGEAFEPIPQTGPSNATILL